MFKLILERRYIKEEDGYSRCDTNNLKACIMLEVRCFQNQDLNILSFIKLWSKDMFTAFAETFPWY